MEENNESSETSMVPIALALFASVLGGAGLYFGLDASQRLAPLTESMGEGTSSAARLDKQFSKIEMRLAEIAGQTDELKQTVDRLRVYSSRSEQRVQQAVAGVKSNREELVKLAGTMNELASFGASGISVARPPALAASTARTPSAAATSTDTSTAAPLGGGGTLIYKIQSGDTFAKIAALKGLSLDGLLEANPAADPRSLRIGQEINIPRN